LGGRDGLDRLCALARGTSEARSQRSGTDLLRKLNGEQIDQSYVRHLLPRLATKAGIEKRVHAHGLRHAYAVELDREGASLSAIRDLLGHFACLST
jgi:site-specific recombinase XerD